MLWKLYTLWQAINAAGMFLRWMRTDLFSGDHVSLADDLMELKKVAVIIGDTVQQIEQELSL